MTDNLLRASILKQFCLLDFDTVIKWDGYKINDNYASEEMTPELDKLRKKYCLRISTMRYFISISFSLNIILRNL